MDGILHPVEWRKCWWRIRSLLDGFDRSCEGITQHSLPPRRVLKDMHENASFRLDPLRLPYRFFPCHISSLSFTPSPMTTTITPNPASDRLPKSPRDPDPPHWISHSSIPPDSQLLASSPQTQLYPQEGPARTRDSRLQSPASQADHPAAGQDPPPVRRR